MLKLATTTAISAMAIDTFLGELEIKWSRFICIIEINQS